MIAAPMSDLSDRRAFLRAAAAASVTWAAADLLQIDEAFAVAAQQSVGKAATLAAALTPEQTQVVAALAERILPSIDGRPGAKEAGAIFFIDRALATFNAAQRPVYVEGVTDLNRRAQAKAPGVGGFAALTASQQDEVIHEIEATPFFQGARFDTIVGTLALPIWGGNRNYEGWRLLGFDHQMSFQAPFGYYDAETTGTK